MEKGVVVGRLFFSVFNLTLSQPEREEFWERTLTIRSVPHLSDTQRVGLIYIYNYINIQIDIINISLSIENGVLTFKME